MQNPWENIIKDYEVSEKLKQRNISESRCKFGNNIKSFRNKIGHVYEYEIRLAQSRGDLLQTRQ